MLRKSIDVSLPPNWEQLAEDRRAYRRRGVAGGVLRVRLHPPLSSESVDSASAAAHLTSLLTGIDMDLGVEIKSLAAMHELGPIATSIRKSNSQGLLQFWLIAGEITVFASYTMGALAEAQQDLAEAQRIITGLKLVEESAGPPNENS